MKRTLSIVAVIVVSVVGLIAAQGRGRGGAQTTGQGTGTGSSTKMPVTQPPAADLVLVGGRVVTMDDAKPEAEAVAILGDTIEYVGSKADMLRFTGKSTQVIDLAGAFVMPGFIEGHGHFTGIGEAKLGLDRKSTRLNSSHIPLSRMPSSA